MTLDKIAGAFIQVAAAVSLQCASSSLVSVPAVAPGPWLRSVRSVLHYKLAGTGDTEAPAPKNGRLGLRVHAPRAPGHPQAKAPWAPGGWGPARATDAAAHHAGT